MGLIDENKNYNDPLHINPEVYHVDHPRESYYLNKRLLDAKNAWGNVKDLVETHLKKLDLFDEIDAGKWDEKLPEAAKELEKIEFTLQSLWGFDCNAQFHEWYLIPKCECPIMDNRERQGTKYNIINLSCPVHGKRK